MNNLKVLSLFDGISCGRVALERAGHTIDTYYASEINKYAIKVANSNYGDTIELGNVCNVKYQDGILESENGKHTVGKIDLLMGGSPCQGFSNAGKGLNFNDPRSKLFWEFVRILHETNPTYFLLENVVMKPEWQKIISDALGTEPILINSKLTSPAVRKRLYWTNIKGIEQPSDSGITFGMIREHNVPVNSNMYYTSKGLEWIKRHEDRTGKKLRIIKDDEKMQMLEASMHKKYSSQRFFAIEDTYGKRYITPLECERCMGLPDNYTAVCSNTQRYMQLGNGWEVNTIAHIFRYM